MKKASKKTLIVIFLFSLFILVVKADAATLYFVPEAKMFGIGQEFSVDVKIDSEDVFINATQATVKFPNDILELLEVDRVSSIFSFWVEEPVISNEEGTISFIGGTAKGVAGEALQVLRMKFKAKGIGSAELTISDAVVTASDGKGTNVLSTIVGTSIGIDTEVIEPEKVTPPTGKPEGSIEEPEKIDREPVLAKDLPEEPELRVSLYPDESQWYDHLGEVIVIWDLPPDVTEVATRLSKSPDKKPGDIEEELFTGKSFGTLEEGIWYVRVQFKNNIGWGPLAYYKISIDTTPPLPFEIEIDNHVSDNPTPEIKYETQDSLSGVSHSLIFIDGKGPTESTEATTVLPVQPPGKHTVLVRVVDFAGNKVEDDLEFEILPLPTPTITFLTKIISEGELIFISGKTVPHGFVDIKIFDKAGQEIFTEVSTSDGLGNWEVVIERTLAKGEYTLSVSARDNRGAVSYPIAAQPLKVKAKIVLSIGLIDLGWFEIFIIMILTVISVASISGWYYVAAKQKREAYKTIAGRDIDKLSTLLADDVKKLEARFKNIVSADPKAKAEIKFYIGKVKGTIVKMKKYLGKEIEKLK